MIISSGHSRNPRFIHQLGHANHADLLEHQPAHPRHRARRHDGERHLAVGHRSSLRPPVQHQPGFHQFLDCRDQSSGHQHQPKHRDAANDQPAGVFPLEEISPRPSTPRKEIYVQFCVGWAFMDNAPKMCKSQHRLSQYLPMVMRKVCKTQHTTLAIIEGSVARPFPDREYPPEPAIGLGMEMIGHVPMLGSSAL